jgi:alpha-D-ribose 1-methylphosphonate 5-triphosphate diphosphatase PhnM
VTRREFAISARGLLTNARIITPHGVVEGSLAIDGGRIAEIMPRSYRDGTDCAARC